MKRLISESTREGVFMDVANDVVDRYNAIVGGAAAILSTILGQNWILFALYILFMFLDWVTGTHRSRKLKIESSEAGREGIKKKGMNLVILIVGFTAPVAFMRFGDLLGINLSFTAIFGWFILATLMVNELRSIAENLVECGYNVPPILTKGLAVADKLITSKAESILPDESDD